MVKYILVICFVVLILIFSIFYSKRKYEKGFGVGVLSAFVWMQSNKKPNEQDIFDVYKEVTESSPEDGIYICVPVSKGKFKIKKHTKMINFRGL